MSSQMQTDSAATREGAPSPIVEIVEVKEPSIPPIRQRTVSFANQRHPGRSRSNKAQKQSDVDDSGDDHSSETASSEYIYEASDSGGSERTASLYDGSSSSDDTSYTRNVKYVQTDSSDSDSTWERSNGPSRRVRGTQVSRPSERTRYDRTEDLHTIHPGLKTPMGSHQGSMLKAANRSKAVRRLATKIAVGNQGGGLITIKKLLTRTTIANGKADSFCPNIRPYS